MFGRDAGMAEAWLVSQEPIVRSAELGGSVAEVENLIKRHEGFQKAAAAWEERFAALERLTTVRGGGIPHTDPPTAVMGGEGTPPEPLLGVGAVLMAAGSSVFHLEEKKGGTHVRTPLEPPR